MHTLLKTIEKATDSFMFGHVTIDKQKIEKLKIIKNDKTKEYFSLPPYLENMKQNIRLEIAYQIIHCFNAIQASLQYSFFTVNAQIRFDGIDSQWVIRMLDDIFAEYKVRSITDIYRLKVRIVERLMDSNITMLRSRVETIEELFDRLNFYDYGECYADVETSLSLLGKLICFKQDLFFKKGLFAIMMTGRMIPELSVLYPSYVKSIASLPVPADYQIPKMLRHYGVMSFSSNLESIVDGGEFVQPNSEYELNIRAATVKACEMIAKQNDISVDKVDAWLFIHRQESRARHHLCVTEFY